MGVGKVLALEGVENVLTVVKQPSDHVLTLQNVLCSLVGNHAFTKTPRTFWLPLVLACRGQWVLSHQPKDSTGQVNLGPAA